VVDVDLEDTRNALTLGSHWRGIGTRGTHDWNSLFKLSKWLEELILDESANLAKQVFAAHDLINHFSKFFTEFNWWRKPEETFLSTRALLITQIKKLRLPGITKPYYISDDLFPESD
jgi:hypothetical protein